MVFWSLGCKQSCLHGHRACDVDISAWAKWMLLRCSPDMSAWSTWDYAIGDMSSWPTGTCVSPRFVCMVYGSLCWYQTFLHGLKDPLLSQTCLHGLQEHILLRDMSAWSSGAYGAPRHVFMIYKSMCFDQKSLNGVQDPVMLADMSGGPQDHMLLSDILAWSKAACTACSQTCLYHLHEPVLLSGMSSWSTTVCAAPRHVCLVCRSLCCYQTCLHGLQRCVLLPNMSAWSAGACDATRHVCMIYRNMFRSQTCLHGLQKHINDLPWTHRPRDALSKEKHCEIHRSGRINVAPVLV